VSNASDASNAPPVVGAPLVLQKQSAASQTTATQTRGAPPQTKAPAQSGPQIRGPAVFGAAPPATHSQNSSRSVSNASTARSVSNASTVSRAESNASTVSRAHSNASDVSNASNASRKQAASRAAAGAAIATSGATAAAARQSTQSDTQYSESENEKITYVVEKSPGAARLENSSGVPVRSASTKSVNSVQSKSNGSVKNMPRATSGASITSDASLSRSVSNASTVSAAGVPGPAPMGYSSRQSSTASVKSAQGRNLDRNDSDAGQSQPAGTPFATPKSNRIQNEEDALLGKQVTAPKTPQRTVQYGMAWDEDNQEWQMKAREASVTQNPDLLGMIADGEIDLSEEGRGVASRRPSVMRLQSNGTSFAENTVIMRPTPDASRMAIPKLIHGSGRPSIINAPYGNNWALDVLALPHNGVRKELTDCYEILLYYELNWEETFNDEITRFFAWWEIFQNFVLRYFDSEEELLFPWIEGKGGFLSDSFLEANRTQRKTKMIRLIKGVGNSQKAFLKKELRSELVTSLKFSIDRLTIMLMEYFGEEEIVLTPVILQHFTLSEKREFDKKYAEYFTNGPGGGLDCIQLSRWQLGTENRDAVRTGQKNDKAVQEWRYDNLNSLKWASYGLWEKKYFGRQVITVQYFKDKRRKIQEEKAAIGYGANDKNRTERAVHWTSEVNSLAITPRSNSSGALETPRSNRNVPAGSMIGTPRSGAITPTGAGFETPRSLRSVDRFSSDPTSHAGSLAGSRSISNVPGSRGVSNVSAQGAAVNTTSRAASQAGSRAASNVSTSSQKMRAVPADQLPYQQQTGFNPRMRFDDALEMDSIASSREDSSVSTRSVPAPVVAPVPVKPQQRPMTAPANAPKAAAAAQPRPSAAGAPKSTAPNAQARPVPVAGAVRQPVPAKGASVNSSRNSSTVSGSSRQTSSAYSSSSSRQTSSVVSSRSDSRTYSDVEFDDVY